jgi:chromosome segregation ATPase
MNKREKLIHQLEFLKAEFTEIDEQYQKHLREAQQKGSPPEQIRDNQEEIFSEFNQIKGQLELLEITPDISEEAISRQEKHVEMIKDETDKAEEHLKHLKDDLDKRITEWEGGLHHIVDHMNKMLNLLLKDIFLNVSIQIKNYNNERNAGLYIEAETKGDNRKYRQLSGGEKTLLAQAIILALHMISQSPIHAIDEFTQKLDRKNKTLAFSMALLTYRLAKESRKITPQFVLITPSLDDVELSDEFAHKIMIESKVNQKKVKA